MSWQLIYAKQAQKDARQLAASGLKAKAQRLLDLIAENPYQNPPPDEKLIGDLAGAYSRRINIQHRLVYQVYEQQQVVKVIRLRTAVLNMTILRRFGLNRGTLRTRNQRVTDQFVRTAHPTSATLRIAGWSSSAL